MTPADWALLSPGLASLALHGPAWARSRHHSRQLDAIETGGCSARAPAYLATQQQPPDPGKAHPYIWPGPRQGAACGTCGGTAGSLLHNPAEWDTGLKDLL